MAETEFFGNLDIKPVYHQDGMRRSELIDWIVVDPTLTVNRYREIEDGDLLQVFDRMGRLLLNKHITRDYDSYFNLRTNKQMYKGQAIAWVPYKIDFGLWNNLFINHQRARLVKKQEQE